MACSGVSIIIQSSHHVDILKVHSQKKAHTSWNREGKYVYLPYYSLRTVEWCDIP